MRLDGRYGLAVPAGLTDMADKAVLYALDPYFRDGLEDLGEAAGASLQQMALSHSLILLRPDAIACRKAQVIVEWLSRTAFALVDCLPVQVDRHQVRALWQYQWNCAVRERKDACDALMCSSPSLLLIVRDDSGEWRSGSAAARFAGLKGSADPALRRPTDLRAMLLHKSRMLSFIHSPDEAADFVRELAIFLDANARQPVYAKMLGGVQAPAEAVENAIQSLYRQLPERSLELGEALDRIAASARGAIGDEADREAVAGLVQRARAGGRLDWRELFSLLDRHGVAYEDWDRIVIAGHVITMDIAGKVALIGHPPGRSRNSSSAMALIHACAAAEAPVAP